MKKLFVMFVLMFGFTFIYGQGTVKLMNWEAEQYMKSKNKKVEQKVDTLKRKIDVSIRKQVSKQNAKNVKASVKCINKNDTISFENTFEEKISTFDDIVSWLKIIFLNQKMPNESDKEYKERIECLGLPGNQPFK